MTATPERPALDEATLAFAEKVFDAARQGDAARLALWLDNGLPPDLRNAQGDSLLMLASYHGHAEAARLDLPVALIGSTRKLSAWSPRK